MKLLKKKDLYNDPGHTIMKLISFDIWRTLHPVEERPHILDVSYHEIVVNIGNRLHETS